MSDTTANNEEALRERIAADREALQAIQDAKTEAVNAAYVGRCFRYHNCYSCPESDADRWWMYSRVIGSDAYGLRVFRFQTDKYGKTEIETTDSYPGTLGEEVSAVEYNDALDMLRDSLAATIAEQFAKDQP